MPYSKKVAMYPASWLELLNKELPFTFLCNNRKEANNFRFRFYGWVHALEAEKHPGYGQAARMVCRVEDITIHFEDRDGMGDPVTRAFGSVMRPLADPFMPMKLALTDVITPAGVVPAKNVREQAQEKNDEFLRSLGYVEKAKTPKTLAPEAAEEHAGYCPTCGATPGLPHAEGCMAVKLGIKRDPTPS